MREVIVSIINGKTHVVENSNELCKCPVCGLPKQLRPYGPGGSWMVNCVKVFTENLGLDSILSAQDQAEITGRMLKLKQTKNL